MRLKLVLLTSLLGAVIGAGLSIAATVLWRPGFSVAALIHRSDGTTAAIFYAPIIVLALFAAFFVYRHTSHRRKFQAALTGILTIAFWSIAVAITYFVVR